MSHNSHLSLMLSRRLAPLAIVLCVANAWGAPNDRGPHIGYLYPAGGQQGAVVEVLIGGQFLGGVNNVYVSGEGVRASVVQYSKPLNNEQIREVRRQLGLLLKVRRAEQRAGLTVLGDAAALTMEAITLPDHPLLRHVDKRSLQELEHWMAVYMNASKRQLNAQLAEMAVIAVTIDSGAALGDRELRLGTPVGLTNPICFQVGSLPEVREQEPNDPLGPVSNRTYVQEPASAPLELPVLLNGQIMPGDVDRFRIHARQGQQLVIEAQARRLMPYLADAVPGWFQATIALYDANGKELAFADDYRFDPDPILFYKIPEDGEYDIEIRDAIYRGREDFVYRIAVGEQPLIAQMFPLGGEYLETLREIKERKQNDTAKHPQRIKPPRTLNGCIDKPGDIDVFKFKGHAGEDIVAEVYARRLHSPLDSVLRLTDASANVVAWNDDHEDKETGLLTHHADSYLHVQLPNDGVYYIYLSDAQHQGGEEYAYRLRLGPPQPDFALRVTPSSINVPAGRIVPICVHALRKDGFTGDIEIVLKDAPPGLTLNGARIPTGRDQVRMTLTAHAKRLDQPVVLQLEGHAQIAGDTITRPATPAEDMTQAFAYRHLVPAQQLLLSVTPFRRGTANAKPAGGGPVRIPEGGVAQVLINVPKNPKIQDVQLELSEPPKGMTLQELTVVPEGLAFTLKAEGDLLKAGYADNLIVEAHIENALEQKKGKGAKQNQRVSLGVLPAIPFEIVKP